MTHPTDPDIFRFGVEFETMLTDASFRPLGRDELRFEELKELIADLGTPSLDYMAPKYPGSEQRSYYLEGYDVVDDVGEFLRLDVKGIEMSTPIATSIDGCLQELSSMYGLLQEKLRVEGLECTCYGAQPVDDEYVGQRGSRDHVAWASAETAMTTYGIHVNVSFPHEIEHRLDREHVRNMIEHYAPALTLLSANTPLRRGPWTIDGRTGKSERSYRRSFTRRPLYFRDDQNFRKEVTVFDITNRLALVGGYVALTTGLMLDAAPVPFTPGTFTDANLRNVAVAGYEAEILCRQFRVIDAGHLVDEALERAAVALTEHELSTDPLKVLFKLAGDRRTPADDILDEWGAAPDISALLKSKCDLTSE